MFRLTVSLPGCPPVPFVSHSNVMKVLLALAIVWYSAGREGVAIRGACVAGAWGKLDHVSYNQ